MSSQELVDLVCCDLGAIVRGRALLSTELAKHLADGVGWVPANQSLSPLGPLAEPSPFGSTGDLRLLPDPATRVHVSATPPQTPLELVLCDIVATDGQPWECCPRHFLKSALADLASEFGVHVRASFEHEFQLVLDDAPALPFSLEARRLAEPFATRLMHALAEARTEPERFFAEYASHQFEVPVEPTGGLASADRSVVLKEVVREIARRHDMRASFSPLLDPARRATACTSTSRCTTRRARRCCMTRRRRASLSRLGASFAAGILRHAHALTALTAPSPISVGAPDAPPLERGRGVPGGAQPRSAASHPARRRAVRRRPRQPASPGVPGRRRHGQPLSGTRRDPARGPRGPARRAAGTADPRRRPGAPGSRPLRSDSASARFPRSLEDALAALRSDATARAWMSPLLYDAYVGIKRSELRTVDEHGHRRNLPTLCTRLLTHRRSCRGCSPASIASSSSPWRCATVCTRSPSSRTPSCRRPPPCATSCPSPARRPPARARSRASGEGERPIAVRCELDGLPMREHTHAPFSATGDVMHACGHDVHMAALVALARAAHALPTSCQRRCSRSFSPARRPIPRAPSSWPSASCAAIAPRAVVAAHIHPGLPGAPSHSTPAPSTPRATRSRYGRGTAVARRLPARGPRPDPRDRAGRRGAPCAGRATDRSARGRPSLTVGVLEGGSAENVIPARATARGALRAYRAEDRAALAELVEEVVPGVAAAHGCRGHVDSCPASRRWPTIPRSSRAPASCWRAPGSQPARRGARAARTTSRSSARSHRSRWPSSAWRRRGIHARPLHHPELLPPDDAVRARRAHAGCPLRRRRSHAARPRRLRAIARAVHRQLSCVPPRAPATRPLPGVPGRARRGPRAPPARRAARSRPAPESTARCSDSSATASPAARAGR